MRNHRGERMMTARYGVTLWWVGLAVGFTIGGLTMTYMLLFSTGRLS